jgi:hypothetical protein
LAFFQALGCIWSESCFSTLTLKHIMEWFDEGLRFIEKHFYTREFYLLREGNPNFDGLSHLWVIGRKGVNFTKTLFSQNFEKKK